MPSFLPPFNLEIFALFQITVDCLLFGLLLYLLIKTRPRASAKTQADILALAKLIRQSGMVSQGFVTGLTKRTEEIKDLLVRLAEKEAALTELLHRTKIDPATQTTPARTGPLLPENAPANHPAHPESTRSDDIYATIIPLAEQGLDESEIARHLQLPEAEVHLFLKFRNLTGRIK
ncbi:MAG: hypothetical protein HQK58_10650 [Deltaproteobacteria bacterium]|nr:hypothetical protein [Deltaproteobacteria bacterium]